VTATAASTGRPTQKPRPTKIATNTGASAVPSPSSALSESTDRSTASGWNAAVNVLIDGTVSPNPTPRQPVASRSSGKATEWLPITKRLAISRIMAARLAHRPARYTRFPPNRWLRLPCSSEDTTAVTACGRNMAP
jgi:hypothetical protein